MATFDKIKSLIKQLMPTGRAFRMPDGGDGDKLISASSESISRCYDDVNSLMHSILPDNDNFTAEDATDWEVRLGMIVNSSVDLSIRKAAIIRKINHPGVITARQSSDYIQDQLHLAGFTGVFVHENLENLSIESILNYSDGFELNDYQLGDQQIGDVYSFYSDCFETFQLGDYQIGDSQLNSYKWCNFVANHIDMEIDSHFFISPENRTFVIGGVDFGTFGTVDSDRTKEFRQLILKLKPVNSVALLLINYT